MALDRSHLIYDRGGGGGDMGFDGFGGGMESFDFDIAGGIENIPAQKIDFNKEAYVQSIIAPAEAARRDATVEAVASGRAISAQSGRPPGDLESEILAGSIRQAGETSALATKAGEEAGLQVEALEQQDLSRRTQAAVAQGQLKMGAWQVLTNIKARFQEMRANHAQQSKLLTRQLGHDRAMAEMNRRVVYDTEMLKINSGMEMLKFQEDSLNLRTAAGLVVGERESVRNQAYRMEYLDRMSKIQSMSVIKDWMDKFGRLSQLTMREEPEMMGGGADEISPTDYNQGQNWWEIDPETQDYNPWRNLQPV